LIGAFVLTGLSEGAYDGFTLEGLRVGQIDGLMDGERVVGKSEIGCTVVLDVGTLVVDIGA
jgi:hypothetical protein